MPTANKIELFARNNNLKKGWLSLGNQLGENYLDLKVEVHCHHCKNQIQLYTKRYKSKLTANINICDNCINKSPQIKG